MADTKTLTPQQSFEQKLSDRIREDIGELMPAEALAEIVSKAIEKSFFEERKVSDRGYYDNGRKEVPWIVALVKKEMDARVQVAVKEWVASNGDKIEKTIKDRFDEGMATAVVRTIDNIFQPSMQNLQSQMSDVINSLRNRTLINEY